MRDRVCSDEGGTNADVEAVVQVAGRYGLSLTAVVSIKRGRARVLTARVDDRPVFVKVYRPDSEAHFVREQMGLAALAGLDLPRYSVPSVLAADRRRRLIVMSALPGTTLDERLAAADPVAAGVALEATAERLGILHGDARRVAGTFDPGAFAADSPGAALIAAIPQIEAFVDRACPTLSAAGKSGLANALAAVAAQVDRASYLRTLTLGDMAPTNVLVTDDGPAFLDLEYCAVRHGCYDAMFWHSICVFPDAICAAMDRAYRRGLRHAGLVVESEQFAKDVALLMSQRLFWTLSWGMDGLFEADRDFAPGVSARSILMAYLGHYLRFAESHPGAAPTALTTIADRLHSVLGRLWETSPAAAGFRCFSGGAAGTPGE